MVALFCIVCLALAAQQTGCLTVEGDSVFAADLARLDGVFAVLPADQWIAHAPRPGSQLRIAPERLNTLLQPRGLRWRGESGVCVERATGKLSHEQIQAALEPHLGDAARQVKLHRVTPDLLPPGKLTFPADSWSTLPAAESGRHLVLWRAVLQAGERRHSVTFDLSLPRTENCTRLARAVRRVEPVQQDSLRPASCSVLEAVAAITSTDPVQGHIFRRAYSAGSILQRDMLARKPLVERGDTATLIVASRGARISLPVTAQQAGAAGDLIRVRNENTGKLLAARVTTRGTLRLELGQNANLANER
jgi:flagella basal body P-ring formation protein FlgA